MIIARSLHEIDTTAGRIWSAAAIAPHRGDVTTVMAAALVRKRAVQRREEARMSVASRDTAPLPAAAWMGPPNRGVPDFDLL